jgi:NTP pyrophosphatase (non-canonical NTP hydrolase)
MIWTIGGQQSRVAADLPHAALPQVSSAPSREREQKAFTAETGQTLNCFIHTLPTVLRPFPHFSHANFSDSQALSAIFCPEAGRRTCWDHTLQYWSSTLSMASRKRSSGNIYQFPLPLETGAESDRDVVDLAHQSSRPKNVIESRAEVVICGTFRKDQIGLRSAYEHLGDLGFKILSPTSVQIASEADGFVYMEGESRYDPQDIEIHHLEAIQRASFVWLHAPEGYVGTSGSLEVGFAHALGVPVYSQAVPADPILRSFVTLVSSPERLLDLALGSEAIPRPPLVSFQKYYKRAAIQRGYGHEDAKDTLVLMLEEMGELARAIRKRTGMVRHDPTGVSDEGLELADVFIYVVHLANILKVDLGKLVQQKELWNLRKFEKTLIK